MNSPSTYLYFLFISLFTSILTVLVVMLSSFVNFWVLQLLRNATGAEDKTQKSSERHSCRSHTGVRAHISPWPGVTFWSFLRSVFSSLCLTCCSNSCLSAVAMDSSAAAASRPCEQNPLRPWLHLHACAGCGRWTRLPPGGARWPGKTILYST